MNTENAGSLPKRHLPFQKPPGLSWAGYKATNFGEWCLCLLQKSPKSKNDAAGWRGQVAGTQGPWRQAEGRSSHNTEHDGSLPKRPLPYQKPQCCPGLGVKTQALSRVPVSLAEVLCYEKRNLWMAWAVPGSQGNAESGRGEKWRNSSKDWQLHKEASPVPDDPRAVPDSW